MNKTLVAFTLLIATSFAAITSDTTLSSSTALASSSGIQMYGAASDNIGNSISNAGDFNGDGIEDFIIGTAVSKAYLVFGTSTARTAALDLSSASNAATSVTKFTFASAGSKIPASTPIIVSAAGNMDKDLYDDVAFGIPTWKGSGSSNDAGIVIVYYGMKNADITTAGATVAIPIDTGAGVSQTKYFLIKDTAGTPATDLVGTSIASAGNIDRDSNGVDDLLIGAPTAAGTGVVYIISGSTTKRTTDVALDALSTNGFKLTGPATALLGTSVAGVGDINGDTYPDAILGAPGTGGAWILYGQSSLATGTLATTGTSSAMLYNYIDSGSTTIQFGQNVGALGDINSNGANDFFVGAPKAGSNNGKLYLYSGIKTSAQIADIASSALATQTAISGPALGYLGWRSDGGEDINNDGVDDFITCAPFTDLSAGSPTYATFTGKCYVFYGKSSTNLAGFDLSSTTLSSSSTPSGFTITGVVAYGFGSDVSVVGTTYTGGGNDFIISSTQATAGGNTGSGSVHLFYGVAPTTSTGSGFRLGASLLVFISFVAALMF